VLGSSCIRGWFPFWTALSCPCRSLIAAAVLDSGWGYSFVVPGVLLMAGGLLMYCFLVVHPEDVGLHLPTQAQPAPQDGADEGEASTLLQEQHAPANQAEAGQRVAHSDMKGISFWEAWQIPGVAPFAFCLFFTKLVAYCLMYWLPFYIRHTGETAVQGSSRSWT
jgi:OPA family glycerol-3-phosphate transporter-like MFS transporter 1/2